MTVIAALFVQEGGCYFKRQGVDPWDIKRDARKYQGPHSVIAHPPCQRWGKMANVNYARWGGEHNRLGNDGGCFSSALGSVNLYGGVLEHPAQSYAWPAHNLVKPEDNTWTKSGEGWTCCVWQSAYGHRANKATWLYYKGVSRPFELCWDRPRGTHQIGFQDQRGKARNKPTLSKAEANATPPDFLAVLVRLATLSCHGETIACIKKLNE